MTCYRPIGQRMSLWSSFSFCGVCRFLRSIECEKQNPINNFAVLKRCRNKCYEMLTIKESNAERFCNNWPLMWLTRLLALLNTKHIGPAFNIFSLLFCKIRRSFQYFLLCLEKDERKKKTSEYNKSQYLLIWVWASQKLATTDASTLPHHVQKFSMEVDRLKSMYVP